jgi:hypothetical protein
MPGDTQFTRTPLSAHSQARLCVSFTTAETQQQQQQQQQQQEQQQHEIELGMHQALHSLLVQLQLEEPT